MNEQTNKWTEKLGSEESCLISHFNHGSFHHAEEAIELVLFFLLSEELWASNWPFLSFGFFISTKEQEQMSQVIIIKIISEIMRNAPI